jgi:hypothetical protein
MAEAHYTAHPPLEAERIMDDRRVPVGCAVGSRLA